MLSKEHRLRTDKEIKALFKNSKSAFGIYSIIRAKKNTFEVSRFAVIAGTKVSKKAVIRNKLKRQIRYIIKKHLENIEKGWDVIVMIKKEAVNKTFKEIEDDLVRSMKKTPLL